MWVRRLICGVFGHELYVQRIFSDTSRKIGCSRCGGSWGMNDCVRMVLPWDGTFVELYKTLGQWPGRIVNDRDE